MQSQVSGRTVARVLRELARAALVVGVASTMSGCEALHLCLNGKYGAPYYARTVRPIPDELVPKLSGLTGRLEGPICEQLCDNDGTLCQIASVADATLPAKSYVVCFSYRENGCPSGWGSGRVPEGLELDPGQAKSLGEYFARAAALEAASVVSFRRLAADLERHGAPRALVRRAKRAATDEKRHAAQASRLSRRFGGKRVRGRIEPQARRTLTEVAIENAREGCVGETFGALLLFARARASTDPQVRTTLHEIAQDEIGHAALAWDLRAYLHEHLDAAGLTEERRALAEAVDAAKRVPVDAMFPFDPGPLAEALDKQVWKPSVKG